MGFVIRKIGVLLVSLIGVITLISLIIYMAPVDPAKIQFGQREDPEALSRLKQQYYMDKPFLVQVYRYLEDLSPVQFIHPGQEERLKSYHYVSVWESGSWQLILKYPFLRRSYVSGELVSDLLFETMPSTLILGCAAMMIAVMLGIFLGALAAFYENGWQDQLIVSFTTFLYAIPAYISAILFAMIFGYLLSAWTHLPMQGSLVGLDDYGNEVLDLKKLILPSLALGLRPIAMICQMTRSALLQVLKEPYIRMASALGLGPARIFLRHAFPNALNPIITTISSWLASLLTGAFFVEYVFNYRGMGDLTIQALNQFDVPVVLGCCVLIVTIFIFIND